MLKRSAERNAGIVSMDVRPGYRPDAAPHTHQGQDALSRRRIPKLDRLVPRAACDVVPSDLDLLALCERW